MIMINGTIIITDKLMSSSGGSFNIKRRKKTQTFTANHQNSMSYFEVEGLQRKQPRQSLAHKRWRTKTMKGIDGIG
jgi:hypothetical protein